MRNIFHPKPPVIDSITRHDLLTVCTKGRARMVTHIRQHVLDPPLERPKKQRRNKLKTFTKRNHTTRTTNTLVAQMTKLLQSAYKRLQNSGVYVENTLEYPLALCNEFGEMRDRHKSKIKDAMEVNFEAMFIHSMPELPESRNSEVIIDFLWFLHNPTPPDVTTYNDLASYYWSLIVLKVRFRYRCDMTTVVIDKTEYLPAVRQLIHKERKKRSGGAGSGKVYSTVKVDHDERISYGSNHVSPCKTLTTRRNCWIISPRASKRGQRISHQVEALCWTVPLMVTHRFWW